MALTATQLCLAHRYLYYCLCESVISDSDYDRLESAALRESEDSPLSLPGSDKIDKLLAEKYDYSTIKIKINNFLKFI